MRTPRSRALANIRPPMRRRRLAMVYIYLVSDSARTMCIHARALRAHASCMTWVTAISQARSCTQQHRDCIVHAHLYDPPHTHTHTHTGLTCHNGWFGRVNDHHVVAVAGPPASDAVDSVEHRLDAVFLATPVRLCAVVWRAHFKRVCGYDHTCVL